MASSSSVCPSLLPRSISNADLTQTEKCREYIKKAWVKEQPPYTNYFNATPSFTLTIPALNEYPEKEFRSFVFKQIINYSVKDDLESNHTLNWCPGTSHMVPLYTTGDGNCLLHAASLGMWGFQDRDYTLRKAVHDAVVCGKENTLYDRWRSWRREELRQFMADLEPQQWKREWELVIQSASLDRSHGSLGYLDQFHIFSLCNVLRRPILLYSPPKIHSRNEGDTLQQIDFHGIYLPLLWDPYHCIKNPLPIVFFNGHFSALTIIDNAKEYTQESLLFPLMDCYGNDLPVRFLMQGESQSAKKRDYLKMTHIPPPPRDTRYYITRDIPCAKLELSEQPKYMKPLLSGFIDKCFDAYHQTREPVYANQGGNCRRTGCHFAGSPMYNGYCSACYKAQQREGSQRDNYNSGGNGYPSQESRTNSRYSANEHGSSSYRREEEYRSDWRNSHTAASSGSRENELEASTVLCSNNCKRVGFADYLGMCKECFESKTPSSSQRNCFNSQSGHPSSSQSHSSSQSFSSSSTKAIAPPLPPMKSEEIRGCRTPGCDFFGKAATKFFCSKCYGEKLPQLSQAGPPSSSSSSDNMPLCAICRHFHANPEYGELCSSCFKEKTKQDSHIHENVRKSMTPPTQRRNQSSPSHSRDQHSSYYHNRDQSPSQQYRNRDSGENVQILCSVCLDYHANPEYGELCSECFKEKTKRDASQENKRQSPLAQRRNQYSPQSRPSYNRDQSPIHSRDHLPINDSDDMPKCSKCRDFHADPEYGELSLCSNCFKEKTKLDSTSQKNKKDIFPPTNYRDQPPTHIRDQPPTRFNEQSPRDQTPTHYKDQPPTRFNEQSPKPECILCSHDVPLDAMNYICREHALKCREDLRRKHSSDRKLKRSPDPERNNFDQFSNPIRNEYDRSPDPAKRKYERSPGPVRKEYDSSPDPERYKYERSPGPGPVRKEYDSSPDPERYKYERSPDPARNNTRRSSEYSSASSDPPRESRHPLHDQGGYAKKCLTIGCNEYVDPIISVYCEICRNRYLSFQSDDHSYDDPNHPQPIPPLPTQLPLNKATRYSGIDRRSSDPYFSSGYIPKDGRLGGAYTPPAQRHYEKPHPFNTSNPQGDRPHPLEDSPPKRKPRVPRDK